MKSNSSDSKFSKTRIRLLAAVVFVAVAGLTLLLVVSHEQYLALNEQELSGQRVINLPQELVYQQALEDSLLNSTELLDSASGTYRIPIERAMELVELEAAK